VINHPWFFIEIGVRFFGIPQEIGRIIVIQRALGLVRVLDHQVLKSVLRPDRLRTATAPRVHTAPVAGMLYTLILQGLPTVHEISALIIETYVMDLPSPIGK
jgi:hypothetical protein